MFSYTLELIRGESGTLWKCYDICMQLFSQPDEICFVVFGVNMDRAKLK